MTIDPTETIGGCPLPRIRDYVRRYLHYGFDLKQLSAALKVKAADGITIIKWLRKNGYIERGDSSQVRLAWSCTNTAGSLANASARRRINRTTADRLLGELVERATEVNRSLPFAYFVTRIVVGGSYLTESATLGDLDIGVALTPVEADPQRHRRLERSRLAAARTTGRAPTSIVGRIYWPQEEVFRFLKARSPTLHFVPLDDGFFKESGQRVIYEFPKPEEL